jgi:hypothetical protein
MDEVALVDAESAGFSARERYKATSFATIQATSGNGLSGNAKEKSDPKLPLMAQTENSGGI